MYGRGRKLSKPRKQNIKSPFISEENKENFKDRIVRDLWKLFETEEQKEEKKESEKKKKQNERIVIIDKIIWDIRTLFGEEEEDYCKPKRVSNFWNIYFEHESNGDKNSNLSLDKHVNKIKPYYRDIIIDLQSSNTWEI